jgi:hypothetical protein
MHMVLFPCACCYVFSCMWLFIPMVMYQCAHCHVSTHRIWSFLVGHTAEYSTYCSTESHELCLKACRILTKTVRLPCPRTTPCMLENSPSLEKNCHIFQCSKATSEIHPSVQVWLNNYSNTLLIHLEQLLYCHWIVANRK